MESDLISLKLPQGRTKATGRRIARAVLAAAFLPALALAQYTPPYVGLTGTLMSSNGMPAANYVITLAPSQVMYVGGTGVVVANANCGTDTNGAVIGTLNPVGPAILSATPGTGTLPVGNYFVKVTWYDSFSHQTLSSPEAMIQLAAAGSIVVLPPAAGAPLSAVGMNVYIGTGTGAETYQGQTTNPASTYTQSAALTAGANPPITNNTVCMVVANDAAWPIGGYSLNVTTPGGNTVPGFPQQVQFVGPGSSYNLTSGLPQWNGRVTYPIPVLTIPYNHNPQSISGPLSMTNYNIYNVGALGVGTALPAWGVDVEGPAGSNYAAINANTGYLVSGAAGSAGQCLASDGNYFDTPVSCITSVPAIYYQTLWLNSTPFTQRPVMNFSSRFNMADVSSPASTDVDVNGTGTETKVVTAAGAGASGHCAVWESNGGIGDSGNACLSATQTDYYFTFTGCSVVNSGNLNSCAGNVNFTSGQTTPSFPAMPDAAYTINCTVDTGTVSSASFSVTGPSTSASPSFSRTTTGFSYVWTEVMSLSGDGSNAPSINCHLHHS